MPEEERIQETAPGESSDTAEPSPPFLTWPPPGLEQIQGLLLSTISYLALGGIILIVPLWYSIGTEQNFTSFGPFGFNWWIIVSTTGLGLLLLLEGFHRLFRILWNGNLGVKQGHTWLTVAHVATDISRDTGFLIQGARMFSLLDQSARQSLLRIRLVGVVCYSAASLWIIIGFVLSVFLAARGIINPTAMGYLISVPILLFLICGIFFRLKSSLVVLATRRKAKDELATETRGLIDEWKADADALHLTGILGETTTGKVVVLRVAAAIVSVVGLTILVPIITLTFMSAFVPGHLSGVMPRFQGVQDRAMTVEFLRSYRLESDPATTPQLAGEALVNLNYVGTDGKPYEFHRPPRVLYEQRWLFGRNRRGQRSDALLEKPTADLTEEEWSALRNEASNPAHQEFNTLARASEADFLGPLYKLPFPDTYTAFEVAVPRFQGVSDGARSHVAKAAYELHTGDPAQAERTIREVISAGFLMVDEHPTLIGNLVGVVIAEIGGAALESLYRATGNKTEADLIKKTREESEHLSRARRGSAGSWREEEFLIGMARVVTDENALRGLRWEFLPWVTTGTSFTNLHLAVFGPGDDYDQWLNSAHDSLVRYSSEEDYFYFLKHGFLVAPASLERRGFLEWLLSLTFGKSDTPISFAALVRAVR